MNTALNGTQREGMGETRDQVSATLCTFAVIGADQHGVEKGGEV